MTPDLETPQAPLLPDRQQSVASDLPEALLPRASDRAVFLGHLRERHRVRLEQHPQRLLFREAALPLRLLFRMAPPAHAAL